MRYNVGISLRYLLLLAREVLLLIIIFLLAGAKLNLPLHIAGHGPVHRIHNSGYMSAISRQPTYETVYTHMYEIVQDLLENICDDGHWKRKTLVQAEDMNTEITYSARICFPH